MNFSTLSENESRLWMLDTSRAASGKLKRKGPTPVLSLRSDSFLVNGSCAWILISKPPWHLIGSWVSPVRLCVFFQHSFWVRKGKAPWTLMEEDGLWKGVPVLWFYWITWTFPHLSSISSLGEIHLIAPILFLHVEMFTPKVKHSLT